MMSGAGSVPVVIASVDAIVPLYDCEAVTLLLSVAVMAKAYAPALVGVPLMVPVDASSDSPAGSAPDVTENDSGAVPPDVCTV